MAYFNVADFLVHRHVREGLGDRVALVGTTTCTYGDLAVDLARFGGGLRDNGLRRDDRVAVVMADDVAMATAVLGVFHAGCVAVPLSTMLNNRELAYVLRDSGARAVVTTREFLGVVTAAVNASPAVEYVIAEAGLADLEMLRSSTSDHVTIRAWTDMQADVCPVEESEPDSWALWLYTSGTTGKPKAAMHRHANVRHVYETYAQHVLGVTESDRCLSVAKMFFAYGIGNSLFFPLAAGATSILQPLRATPETISDKLLHNSPTLFFGVPTFYASLLASNPSPDIFASVRIAVSAGEPLPELVQRRFQNQFGLEILDGIGSTEALHIFLSNKVGDVRPGTTGTPVPGYRIGDPWPERTTGDPGDSW